MTQTNSTSTFDKDKFYWERLAKSRTLTLFSGVNAEVARDVIDGLLFLEAEDPSTPIKLLVNSPGGEVNSGFSIYDTIKFIKPEVKIICTGLCASIATVILIAAEPQNRISMPNCRFLIHQPLIRGGIQGQASDIQIHADEIVKTRAKINHLLSEACGQDLARVEKDTDRDYWMNATESLEYGLVKKIISSQSEL